MICERPIDRYVSADAALQAVSEIINRFSPEIVKKAIEQPTPYKFNYANYWYVEANKLRDVYRYHHSAIRLYEKAVAINPKHWKAWLNRGITLRYLRRYEESVQSFDIATQIYPELAKGYFQKGVSLFKSEDWTSSLNSYEQAIRICPFYPIAWLHKAAILHRLERYDEAIESHKTAVYQRPSLTQFDFSNISWLAF